MKQVGCNMTNTHAYIRATLGLLIGLIAVKFELWYLLIISVVLFFTAYEKYCLMFTLFGINKKLSLENYYHALLPRYSPYASCIFNDNNEVVYMNDAAKEDFNKITHASYFNISNVQELIFSNKNINALFEHNSHTYQLHIRGLSREKILLVYINDITDVLSLQSTNTHLVSDNDLKDHLLAQQSKFATTGELIENITHQMKQPLATLSAVLINIQFTYPLSTVAMNKEMQKTSSLIQIMNRTINDFKNFFKADKEQDLFSVARCMKDVLLILNSSLEKEDIKLINNVDATLIVKGYKNEFTQVLLNIITNAKEAFTETKTKQREIKVNTSFENDTMTLEVIDTAGGISIEHIDKIFNAHYTTKGDKEGTGIGLHMSKIIIEKDMCGSINVNNVEHGARFTIKLPAKIAI